MKPRAIGFWHRRALLPWASIVALGFFLGGCVDPEARNSAKLDLAMSYASPTQGGSIHHRVSKADPFPPTAADSFEERFTGDSFADRFGAVTGSVSKSSVSGSEQSGTVPPGSYKVASLSPDVPNDVPAVKQGHTQLIGFKNSAFPFSGSNPRTGSQNYSRGARYIDNRVLVHVPPEFDIHKPGVIVVFFHGHGATLERDVRDRQLLPKQITESGANAVLVAPQLAYDAADSSAGKFWEPGGMKRFLAEAAGQLSRVYGDARTSEAFSKMPVVIVAYSGGFVSAAWSLHVGDVDRRVAGVVLLDALYGELDKFASWIVKNRSAFFISAYTRYTKRHDDELAQILKEKGIPVARELHGSIKAGTVAFLATEKGIRHRDYVTLAWTEHPITDVLLKISKR